MNGLLWPDRLAVRTVRPGVHQVHWRPDGGRFDRFVVVRLDVAGDATVSIADVLILPTGTTRERAGAALRRLPGCALVAAGRSMGCLLRARCGELVVPGPWNARPEPVMRWAVMGYISIIRTGRLDPS